MCLAPTTSKEHNFLPLFSTNYKKIGAIWNVITMSLYPYPPPPKKSSRQWNLMIFFILATLSWNPHLSNPLNQVQWREIQKSRWCEKFINCQAMSTSVFTRNKNIMIISSFFWWLIAHSHWKFHTFVRWHFAKNRDRSMSCLSAAQIAVLSGITTSMSSWC